VKKDQALIVFAGFALMGLIAGPAGSSYRGEEEEDEQLATDAWRIATALVAAAPKGVIEP
jgi:hypothetical protein